MGIRSRTIPLVLFSPEFPATKATRRAAIIIRVTALKKIYRPAHLSRRRPRYMRGVIFKRNPRRPVARKYEIIVPCLHCRGQ